MSQTKTIAAGKFKAKCLALLDEVQASGEEIIVTKYGKPVAKIAPIESEGLKRFNELRGKGGIKGDIISPLGKETWGDLQ